MQPIDRVDDVVIDMATPRQQEVLKYRKQHTLLETANHFNLDPSVIQSYISRALQKAAKQGHAPHAGMDKKAADGFTTKRVSTFYDDNGQISRQWHIQEPDKEKQLEMLRAYAQGLCKDIKPITLPEIDTSTLDNDLMNVYTITDAHIGMLAWEQEGGDDWDVDIATKTIKAIFLDMMQRAPKAKTCIINQGGDWQHYDSMLAVTPTSGHHLDADSRPSKMAYAAGSLIRFLISEALKLHEKVVVVLQEGNHDTYSQKKDVDWAIAWGSILTDALNLPKDRLEFVINEVPFYAYKFGHNMLGFHHGHKKGMKNLPQLFACQFREMWGTSKFVDIHKGHYHCLHMQEENGATVIQHPSIVAADAYSSHNGYFSNRAAMSITYHKEYGRQGITFSTPEMLGL